MRVLVTRPQREAEPWVARLRERGLDAQALPLIEIGPAPDMPALQAAQEQLAQFDAVMFVSSNAVHGFSEANRAAGRMQTAWPAIKTRAWATGPGTRDALRACGVPASAIDAPADDAAQFDSEALWARVAPAVRAGSRVLIVRGADAQGQLQGRDWLAQQLEAAGAQVQAVASYTRRAPAWGDAQRAAAAAALADGSPWLLTSSEAVHNLRALLPAQDFARARAIATHERIAEAAREAGFGVVRTSRPAFEDIVRSIESAR
jgi:uroporphyrinogen-III synthase